MWKSYFSVGKWIFEITPPFDKCLKLLSETPDLFLAKKRIYAVGKYLPFYSGGKCLAMLCFGPSCLRLFNVTVYCGGLFTWRPVPCLYGWDSCEMQYMYF